MESKRINIVTINLNNKDGLEKTIKSVVEQTYFDKVNYIVIDGESTDGSVDVIKQYDDKISHWVSEKDNGMYNAMNKGVDLCNGEYVLFLDSGDYFHDNKVIEDVYEELDTDIVYGGLNVHTGKRQYILNDDYYLNKGLPHPSTFTKTKLLRENKFNEDYKIISDWIFFYETIYLKRTDYKRLNRVISDFFLGGISSNAKNCNQEKEKYFKSLEKDESHVKIAMCSIGRLENKYAVEFVDFYEKMGVDKFYIYDNNYGDEEHFEEVLKPYIDNGLVEIINYRDKSYCQVQSYQDCYNKHGKEFDWICFFDFDEYILLAENLKTLKQLLSLDIYKRYDVLHINELIYGDSEKLRYENLPLTQRFTKPVQPIDYKRTFDFPENCHVKTIVRGGLDKVLWNGTPHTPTNTLKCCNAAGEPCQSNSPFVIPYCYKNVCLRHYKTKTLEEYYEIKVKRGYPDGNKDLFKKKSWIDEFFKENVKTKEKLEFINELLEGGKRGYDCKIGVVIPCYNSENYIEETIDSLKKQTFVDWKCVIVNDGSTDNSEGIILKCIDGDKRFSYIKQENHGLPYTRNVGIRNLNSKYIFCLDSDDIIDENYFSMGVEFLDNNPDYSVFYGNAKFLYDDGTTKDWKLPEYSYTSLLRGNIIYCSFLYRRSDYERTDGYDETMKGFEDWDFLIRLLKNAGKVYRSKSVLFYYRRHEGSMDETYNRGDNRIKMINYIFDKNRDVYEKNGIDINFLLKPYVKKKEMKKLALIIPTKDNSESLLRLLYSIVYHTEYDKAKLALYIVDNGSKENEKNKVIEHINRVIKEYGYNINFYETDNYTLPQLYNFVVNEKVDADTDLLLFCTDNVELTNDCISNLVNNWSEQCGTLGARLMLEDNTIQHIGYNIKKDNFTCYDVVQKQVLPAEYRNTKINVYGNSNSFMLTSFALWKQLNGFDEKYKSNFFDIDYSIKALLNGKNSYNITGTVCWYHKAIKSKYAKRDENRISKRIKEYLTIIDETAEKRREDKAKNA